MFESSRIYNSPARALSPIYASPPPPCLNLFATLRWNRFLLILDRNYDSLFEIPLTVLVVCMKDTNFKKQIWERKLNRTK